MKLLDCFIDTIAYVAYFADSRVAVTLPYDQVRGDVEKLLGESRTRAEAEEIDSESYDNARFAVVAWIDERMMASGWKSRSVWQRSLLQKGLYKTTDAGILFFDRLKELGPEESAVREVYYLCVALGFTGRYCLEGDDVRLDQLKSSNSKMLTGSSMGVLSVEGSTLFPGAYESGSADGDEKGRDRRESLIYGLLAGVPLLILVAMWFFYRFILTSEISSGLV